MHETNNFLFLAFHTQFIYAIFIWQILTLYNGQVVDIPQWTRLPKDKPKALKCASIYNIDTLF